MEQYSSKRKFRDESSEFRIDSHEVKRIREDLLENLDDGEINAASHELDFFMKIFAEEIAPASKRTETVIELTSESGESQPDIGYLLGASDDVLGFPSSEKETKGNINLGRIESGSLELDDSGGFWGFGEEVSGFDSFDFGAFDNENYSDDYVALDGLFDYPDLGFGSTDLLWRPETSPAK